MSKKYTEDGIQRSHPAVTYSVQYVPFRPAQPTSSPQGNAIHGLRVAIGQWPAAHTRSTWKQPNSAGSTRHVLVLSRTPLVVLQAGVSPSGTVTLRICDGSPDRLASDHSQPSLRSPSFFSSPTPTSLDLSYLLSSPPPPLFCPTIIFTPSLSSPYLSSYILRLFVIYRWLKLMVCSLLNRTEQFPSSSPPRGHSSCVQ